MKGTQSLERALDILFVLGEAGGTLSVTDIAEKVSIPESSAYRLLQTLERNGIIERKGQGQIGLGLRIFDLAKSLNNQTEQQLSAIAKPYMKELVQETKETAVLFVRAGVNVISIQSIPGSFLVRFVAEDGKSFPMQNGASGKSILAFETDRVVKQILDTLDPQEAQILSNELKKIRENGYSTTNSEVDAGIVGIAAPIFDYKHNVIASLTIAGPGNRIKESNYNLFIEKVVQAAKEITKQLEFVMNVKIV
ncbi:IclR family transcriptional regulator [Sporolactobacillus shoreicorticis]|uniref:IclR family transcriptional regulator n=1 Tax=Sporolactobacillus shoreicorticis TaxID=1923877 RepID=A0ABW5S469_9BACL|nr:IclR family transcriptional regulator [Sporolactobacillus shoreicorticis]MCO7124300.1 IclR family transcriptional regulator [Sporolactobacillus shoreicorticis]